MLIAEEKKEYKDFEIDLNNLDESQKNAVISPAKNIIIKASAGAGKTKTLISAIASYRYNFLNDRICAITYTRAARAEMELRLKELGVTDVEVTTIHVWCRNLLDYFADKHNFSVRILEKSNIEEILQQIINDYQGRVKIKLGILYSYITGNKQMDVSDSYKRILKNMEEQYIEYKRSNMVYDFTDYPLYLYDIMEEYEEVIEGIDALFVDEFQDVDSVQFKIFNKVISKKKFYIGDSWQSIFQFRGADGEVFNKLENFDSYKLKYNYRSHQEIIDYACTVHEALENEIDDKDCYISMINFIKKSSIFCAKGYGGSVTIIDPFGKMLYYNNKEIKIFNSLFQKEVQDNFNIFINKNPMILCRTNKQVRSIEELGYHNVSTVHQAKGLEYDNVIVIDTAIRNTEDLNIAYVALTRAKDNMMILSFSNFETFYRRRLKSLL